MAVTTDEFWDIMNPDKKDQYAIIQPTRELTLFYSTEHDRKLVEKVENKINLQVSSSFGGSALCFATPRVITLHGRHSADVDLLCANYNGIIISTSSDRHIISWDGRQGIPSKKLERYMRRCETCKCDSTGGMKNCITWPVRAICMSEKVDLVAAGFDDGVVRVWDVNSGQVIHILKDTVEDIEQMTPANTCSTSEKVACLQIIVPNLYSSYDTSESMSDKKTPAILLATYQNGYFREWDLISGLVSHTVFTNQKGGISCLFVVENNKQNYIQDELHIFTGARDGSVKCWNRTVYNPENESSSNNLYCRNMWKLLYTIPGNLGNAITSVAAKVFEKSCFGIVVTGAANGEVRVYDYLTGQPIVTLSCGISEKHQHEKECVGRFQRKSFINQDLSEEYDYELPDKAKDNVSHKDAITNIIIHKLKEEYCPCGYTVENDARLVKNPNVSIKRCHGAEGEWEIWILETHFLEPIERIDSSGNYDDIEFKIQTVPLVSESDLIIEEQRKNRKNRYKQSNRENAEELKGFVRRSKTILTKGKFVLNPSFPFEHHNQNHTYVYNLEGYMQGQVVDYRQRNRKRSGSISNRVCPDNIKNDRKSTSEEDEMDEVLPFSYIRQIVKMGEYGIAITYGNFIKVILFENLNDG
ncbi:8106_t:CDS:2 [Racocetra fulgida]|uniref:8106_t:CDS:1 n=1 Tax=Racocetra fulgida TaxID=60492 RepID=A0A9N9G100_9GLOM|nr:8106_t:CDS:2 [Racocetra fulgida]